MNTVTIEELEKNFNEAMFEIYRRANLEAGYNVTRFLQMLQQHGGIETANILINSPYVSDGYTALWERGRLDLTVEALILNKKWYPLFSDQEREIAKQRLTEFNYNFTNE